LEQSATAVIIGHASVFITFTADASQFIPRGVSSCLTMNPASAYNMSRSLTSVGKLYIKLDSSVSTEKAVLFLCYLPRQDQIRGPTSFPPWRHRAILKA